MPPQSASTSWQRHMLTCPTAAPAYPQKRYKLRSGLRIRNPNQLVSDLLKSVWLISIGKQCVSDGIMFSVFNIFFRFVYFLLSVIISLFCDIGFTKFREIDLNFIFYFFKISATFKQSLKGFSSIWCE